MQTLGNITTSKASGGDGIPVELFQIIKMMLGKCCTQYASKFGNSAVAIGLEMSVFIPIPKKGNAKECSDYHTTVHISHASKVMLKILQARLQQLEKVMATRSSTLAWNTSWMEEPGRLQSMGSQTVGHD